MGQIPGIREIDELGAEDLRQYTEFLLMNYRVMDAFWFINIENRHGLEEACAINELVWGKVSQMAARDIKARFGFDKGGLKDFVKAQKLFPWSVLVDYQYIERENEVIIYVPSCPAQVGRFEHGLGEYPCKAMHLAEFSGFAHEIDPRIKVECLYAPPDEHPEHEFCRWRFTLEG